MGPVQNLNKTNIELAQGLCRAGIEPVQRCFLSCLCDLLDRTQLGNKRSKRKVEKRYPLLRIANANMEIQTFTESLCREWQFSKREPQKHSVASRIASGNSSVQDQIIDPINCRHVSL